MYASDIKHKTHSLQNKLHTLYTLNRNKAIDLSFRPPYLRLLERLGNPHLHLPPVIHVAGTNGKGSIIAMLRSSFEAGGYKVHAYTSPHLKAFNERIILAGKEIQDDVLEALIDEALELNEDGDLTFFEITTAIAFTAFARHPADMCLLEVGMGGRLDCTNVIADPVLTMINVIGMDHAEYLGDTITKIAGEKAGIMKPGIPCIIGHQNHMAAQDVFKKHAERLNVPLHSAEPQTQFTTALKGKHQNKNLDAVIKALHVLKDRFPLKDSQIADGLKTVHWSARLQAITPSIFGLKNGTELYLDGGHNPDAGQALATWAKDNQKPLTVILGMMKGKDTQGFLQPLLPYIDELFTVNIDNEPVSQSAEELASQIPNAKISNTYQDALAHAKNPCILICGSLYLAGHVLHRAENA